MPPRSVRDSKLNAGKSRRSAVDGRAGGSRVRHRRCGVGVVRATRVKRKAKRKVNRRGGVKKGYVKAGGSPIVPKVRTVVTAPRQSRTEQSSQGAWKVYVLELQGGYVYVGKTKRTVGTRMQEHMGRHCMRGVQGSGFTKLHAPTGKILPRLGNVCGDGDGAERDETLRQMYRIGPQRVRGWKYVRPAPLTKGELCEIESNIRELFDLCRRCGKHGHFTKRCRSVVDRHGSRI